MTNSTTSVRGQGADSVTIHIGARPVSMSEAIREQLQINPRMATDDVIRNIAIRHMLVVRKELVRSVRREFRYPTAAVPDVESMRSLRQWVEGVGGLHRARLLWDEFSAISMVGIEAVKALW